jgi:allophanate hydrolase
LLAPGGEDALLASIGRVFHADTRLPMGALKLPLPALTPFSPASSSDDEISIAVVGAHLSGMPLNGELKLEKGKFVETAKTAPDYKLYALNGGKVPKPGLLRVAPGTGAAIEVEIWSLPPAGFGRFVAAVPPPMSIGTIKLADGRMVKGFLVEPEALVNARDISKFGGWRAFNSSKADA